MVSKEEFRLVDYIVQIHGLPEYDYTRQVAERVASVFLVNLLFRLEF